MRPTEKGPITRAKIDDYITRSFRDVADEDYVAARALYRIGFDLQFLWSALQSIEKYLKAILLYHRTTTKGLRHDVSRALDRVRTIRNLSFEIPGDITQFIQRLGAQGINRYFEHPLNTDGLGLLELDKAVWHLRKYCRSVLADTATGNAINGRLEEIRSTHSHARQNLMWKTSILDVTRRSSLAGALNGPTPVILSIQRFFQSLIKSFSSRNQFETTSYVW